MTDLPAGWGFRPADPRPSPMRRRIIAALRIDRALLSLTDRQLRADIRATYPTASYMDVHRALRYVRAHD